MKLRKLKEKDAPFMLEWMKDPELNRFFQFDASKLNLESTIKYISSAQNFDLNRHYAVVDENDIYLGTISLKNIDLKNKNAEYAVSMRKSSIGTGASTYATKELLNIAFNELDLNKVYLNVFADNKRAIKFYEKIGFKLEGCSKEHVLVNEEYKDLMWYSYIKKRGAIKMQKVESIEFKQLGDDRGQLVVIESGKDISFPIKRIFYIYGSDQNTVRGSHANRKSEFVLINVSGTSKVMVDYGDKKEIFVLDRPHTGVYIPKMVWKEMYDFSPDSILLVISSEKYDGEEYIRNIDDYYAEIGV